MAAQKQPDWDQLLLRSEELVQQDFSFPRVDRDVHQIEQFSQRLRSKATRGDPSAETLDASRLLAQEGLNPRRINQALQTFELRPTHEDVFRVETASVGEYLQQVHEMIAVAAVQEAQRGAVAAFEGHMDACMDAEWTREKRALLDSVEPFSAAVNGGGGGGYGVAGAGGGVFDSTRSGGALGAVNGASAPALLRGRAARYAEVVRKINAAAAAGQRYEAVVDFAGACSDDAAGGGEKRTTMLRVWHVVQRQLEGVYVLPSSAKSQREIALVAGSRAYLEENFVAYMQTVVQTHRTVAALGGSPSRLGLVHAYLRVREKDRGVLDFDQPGGADTSWLRLYCCLRAGFHSEAVQVARSVHEAATPRTGAAASSPRDLPGLLQEWSEGGCNPLSGDTGAAALAECERLLRDRSTSRGGRGDVTSSHVSHHRVMVYALLSGSNRGADAIAREAPSFFPSIEDFLWLKLSLVRPGPRLGSTTTPTAGAASSGLEAFSLSDLQKYLTQYPSSHYSHGGREPLLYAVVLLLSLQPAAAVAFLAQDPSTREYRLDAVHLGVCLWQAGVLEVSVSDDGGNSGSVGALVGQYARSLAHGDVQLALEYYMFAAAVRGGSLAVRGALLRELLTDTRAYGLLLGAGGAGGEGGALAAFVPDPSERSRVLEAVASECAAAAQLEEAVELFMVAGRPRQALHILSQRLSDTVEPAAIDTSKADEADTLIARGNAAVGALGPSRDPGDLQEVEAFQQLKAIRVMLEAAVRGDRNRVLQALGELAFVPTERYRLQVCLSAAAGLRGAVADRLQAVLLAAAEALSAAGKWDELQTVVSFAAGVPNRVSQAAYQRLNQLQAAGN